MGKARLALGNAIAGGGNQCLVFRPATVIVVMGVIVRS